MDKQAPQQLGFGVRVILSMKYGFLTKCEIKMAGYWPSSFFCVFMHRVEVKVHKHAKKHEDYPSIWTEQAWSIKDLLFAIKHQNMINFPWGTKPYPEQARIFIQKSQTPFFHQTLQLILTCLTRQISCVLDQIHLHVFA